MLVSNRLSLVLSLLLGSALANVVHAQEKLRLDRRLDSLLTHFYYNSNIDTAFVTRPKTKWTLLARLNVSGASINALGMQNEHRFDSELRADYKSTLSLGVSYLGLSLNMALNPAKMKGKYSDFEFNLNAYGKRFGFDFIYQDANNFTGWHEVEGQERVALPEDLLNLKTLYFNTYYAFNSRRFSYPAAFGCNYIQRRSAGSFLLAASAQRQKGRVKDEQNFRFTMTNVALGAGYGYNYVPSRNWLLHISGLPTLIVYSNSSLSLSAP